MADEMGQIHHTFSAKSPLKFKNTLQKIENNLLINMNLYVCNCYWFEIEGTTNTQNIHNVDVCE